VEGSRVPDRTDRDSVEPPHRFGISAQWQHIPTHVRTWHEAAVRKCPLCAAYGGQADIDQRRQFMSTRPSTTLADFERRGIPESVFQ
jgi:hypothetical protein